MYLLMRKPKAYRINVPYEPTWNVPEWAIKGTEESASLRDHISKRRSERTENARALTNFMHNCDILNGVKPSGRMVWDGTKYTFTPEESA